MPAVESREGLGSLDLNSPMGWAAEEWAACGAMLSAALSGVAIVGLALTVWSAANQLRGQREQLHIQQRMFAHDSPPAKGGHADAVSCMLTCMSESTARLELDDTLRISVMDGGARIEVQLNRDKAIAVAASLLEFAMRRDSSGGIQNQQALGALNEVAT